MQLPAPTSAASQYVRFGRYVTRRLKRGRFHDIAKDAEKTTLAVRDTDRAWEDANGPVQDAIADRDASDDDLDTIGQDARAALAGRSSDAMTKAPYTLIFEKGIAYYTAAPLDEEEARYGELRSRLEEHLSVDDSVRVKAVPAITEGLDAFGKSTQALDKARTDEALAATRAAAAKDAWNRQMEKIYGFLVSELGKAKAEQFFPRVSTKKAKGKGEKKPA